MNLSKNFKLRHVNKKIFLNHTSIHIPFANQKKNDIKKIRKHVCRASNKVIEPRQIEHRLCKLIKANGSRVADGS